MQLNLVLVISPQVRKETGKKSLYGLSTAPFPDINYFFTVLTFDKLLCGRYSRKSCQQCYFQICVLMLDLGRVNRNIKMIIAVHAVVLFGCGKGQAAKVNYHCPSEFPGLAGR